MIKLSIDVIAVGIIILSLTLLGIYSYIVLKSIVNRIQLNRKDAYININLVDWDAYFMGESPLEQDIKLKNISEVEALESIFLSYINNFSDSEIQDKIKDFSAQYLLPHYQKMLTRKKWSTRMNALYRVVDFKLDDLLESCKAMEQTNLSHDEFVQLLVIYAQLDPNYFMEVTQSTEKVLSETEYKKLITGLQWESLEVFMDHFDELSSEFKYGFITALGLTRDPAALPFLESKIRYQDSEVRIRSLKAINEIGIVSNIDIFLRFMDSPIWEERLMLTRLLRNVKFDLAVPYLKTLLQDESWWVRSEAAKVIEQSRHGKTALKDMVESLTDQFAIDIAKEYIERGSFQ